MIKLFRKRSLWLPTWQASLIATALVGLAAWFVLANIHPYLSVTEPAPGANILVVEGWVPDSVLERHLKGFEPGQPYDYICTTGSTLSEGSYLSEYKNFAELAAKSLEKLGIPPDRIIVAPSEEHVRDRSYHNALGFKKKLDATDNQTLRNAKAIDVLTNGTHGRRTRILFRKVLGDQVDVGIISEAADAYDPDRWFASSEGVKSVIIESISLAYEWFGKKTR